MSRKLSSNSKTNNDNEKHSAAIREIQSSVPENKKCFECDQRGPTYVNMTIGMTILVFLFSKGALLCKKHDFSQNFVCNGMAKENYESF